MSPWWKLPSPFSKLKLLLLSLRGRWLKEHLKFLKACVPPTPHTVNFIRTLYRWWYSFSEGRFKKIMPVFTQLSLGMLSMFLPEAPRWPCGWGLCCDGLRSNLSAEVTLTLEILIKLAWAFILFPVGLPMRIFGGFIFMIDVGLRTLGSVSSYCRVLFSSSDWKLAPLRNFLPTQLT